MKLFLTCLSLECRCALRAVPKFLAAFLILALILTGIVFGTSRLLYKDHAADPFPIAFVLPEDAGIHYTLAMSMIENMDSFQSMCTFIKTNTKEEALDLLSSGSAAAAIIIPSGMIHGLMNGEDSYAEVLLPDHVTAESIIFEELVSDMAKMVSRAQTGIFALADIGCHQSIPESILTAANGDLNSIYINAVLGRGACFQTSPVDTGQSTGIIVRYTAAAITGLLLLTGLCMTAFYRRKSLALEQQLSRMGIPSPLLVLIQAIAAFLSAALLFLILLLLFFAVNSSIQLSDQFSISAVSAVFPAIFMAICLHQLLYQLAGTSLSGILLQFACALVLLIGCGGILPVSFLPGFFQQMAPMLPSSPMLTCIQSALTGHVEGASIGFLLLWSVAFLTVSTILCHFRKEYAQ